MIKWNEETETLELDCDVKPIIQVGREMANSEISFMMSEGNISIVGSKETLNDLAKLIKNVADNTDVISGFCTFTGKAQPVLVKVFQMKEKD